MIETTQHKSIDPSLAASFDRIYSTDLVYAKDCWQLCGNGHCCNFTRYKSQFGMIGKSHFQELPLLPDEFNYLESKGWTAQFGDFEHRVIDYPLSMGKMKIEFLVGRSKTCACNHDTRTTVCRLYPLLPIFDLDGRLTGVDLEFGIFEEIEKIDGLERACKIENMPLPELNKFLTITTEIANRPKALFHALAYRIAKAHARKQLVAVATANSAAALPTLEAAFLLRRLFDHDALRVEIETLANAMIERHGAGTLFD